MKWWGGGERERKREKLKMSTKGRWDRILQDSRTIPSRFIFHLWPKKEKIKERKTEGKKDGSNKRRKVNKQLENKTIYKSGKMLLNLSGQSKWVKKTMRRPSQSKFSTYIRLNNFSWHSQVLSLQLFVAFLYFSSRSFPWILNRKKVSSRGRKAFIFKIGKQKRVEIKIKICATLTCFKPFTNNNQ